MLLSHGFSCIWLGKNPVTLQLLHDDKSCFFVVLEWKNMTRVPVNNLVPLLPDMCLLDLWEITRRVKEPGAKGGKIGCAFWEREMGYSLTPVTHSSSSQSWASMSSFMWKKAERALLRMCYVSLGCSMNSDLKRHVRLLQVSQRKLVLAFTLSTW